MYVPSFANISILEINFRKTHTEFLLYQSLRSRWYGSHEILKKFIELFYAQTHLQVGLPQCFVFYNFVRREGEGKVFITWEHNFYDF